MRGERPHRRRRRCADIFYFAEGAFRDDVVAQAVDTVAAAGALYFSSAGNSGNFNDGTSGVYEGDFLMTLLRTVLETLKTIPAARALLLLTALALAAAPYPAAAQPLEIQESGLAQIRSLLDEKASRTPIERKIDSKLLLEAKRRRGDALLKALPDLRSGVALRKDGSTLVDIRAEVSESLLGGFSSAGRRGAYQP